MKNIYWKLKRSLKKSFNKLMKNSKSRVDNDSLGVGGLEKEVEAKEDVVVDLIVELEGEMALEEGVVDEGVANGVLDEDELVVSLVLVVSVGVGADRTLKRIRMLFSHVCVSKLCVDTTLSS